MAYFINLWHLPQMSILPCHWFLEGLRLSWIHRNWCIACPLDFSSLCSTNIRVILVSPVTLYFCSMTYSCIVGIVGLYKVSKLLRVFNNLSHTYVSMLASFLWYVNFDDFDFLSSPTISPSSGITCTGSLYSGLSSGSDVGDLSSYIPGTKSSSCKSQKIFGVSAWSVVFHSSHLTSLVMTTLLVSGLYNLYVSLVWLSVYPTITSF